MKTRSLESGSSSYRRFARLFVLTHVLVLLISVPASAQKASGEKAKLRQSKGKAGAFQLGPFNHIPPIDGLGGSFRLESKDPFSSHQVGALYIYEHSHPERRIQWVMIWDGNQDPTHDVPKRTYRPPADNACTITISYKGSDDITLRGGALLMESEGFFGQAIGGGKFRYDHGDMAKKVTRVQIKDGNMNPNPNRVQIDYTPPSNGKCFIKICYDCH